MEELKGLFIGFKSFISKSNKECFVISLLFLTNDEVNSRVTYFVKDIFTTDKKYNEFLESYNILDEIIVKREIVNDAVRYYI